MMSSKNSGFTASDVERYHSGKMSSQERHALEKAALDDPFLADALEGYTFTTTAAADLASIQSRLDEKINRRKVIPFFKKYRWLSAAAIFLIIAGTGWFAYKSFTAEKNSYAVVPNEQSQDKQTTVNKQPETSVPDTANLMTSATASTDEKKKTQQSEKKNSQNVEVSQVQNAIVSNPDTEQNETADGSKIKEIFEKNRNNSPIKNEVASSNQNATRNITEGYVPGVERRDLNMNRSISPEPRTNNISNNNVSREQVFYKDVSNDVAAIRKARNVNLNDTIKDFNVVLQPQKDLDTAEVVVIGYGTQKKSTEPYPLVIIDTLEPAEGFVNFDDYIARNIKMPEEFKTKTTSGEVQLSFDVDKNGQPVNIAVVKSLCSKCDEEAIRLLKEGPKWKKKKNQKGKITIKF